MAEKYTIEKIKDILAQRGFKMMDDKYVSVKTKINIQDSNGYKYFVSMSNFINGRDPEKFRFSNPYSIDNLNVLLKSRGSDTRVISTEYKNAHSYIELICGGCGERFSTIPNHIVSRNQLVCPKCSLREKGLRHRVSIDRVREEYVKSGLVPLFNDIDYKGCDSKLSCKDVYGNQFKISYRSIKQYNGDGAATYVFRMSKLECMTMEYLDSVGVLYDCQYSTKECRYKQALLFDFRVILPTGQYFLIEADGEQHFKYVEYYYGDKDTGFDAFLDAQRRDKIKNEYCKANGITLLRIPYYNFTNGKYKAMIDMAIDNLQNAAV